MQKFSGEILRSTRISKGLTLEALADKISISKQAIALWEAESNSPQLDKLILIADFFGTTVDFFLPAVSTNIDNHASTVPSSSQDLN